MDDPSTRPVIQAPHPESQTSFASAGVQVQGGENEGFRVSHLGNTEVKEAARKSSSIEPIELSLDREKHNEPIHDDSSSARNHQTKSETSAVESETEPDALPMEEITKSPYEPDGDAEIGEKVFDDIKFVLLEDDIDRGMPKQRAVDLFGVGNALCLIRVHQLIEKSGMVFSQEWVHGIIRGNMVGKIPMELLVLCLVSDRFVKADDILLSGICRDMELYSLVGRAIYEWGLTEEYFKLVRGKNYHFTARKRDCFKCAIFVARLYGCFKSLGLVELNTRLLTKARACLSIMEKHLLISSPDEKKKNANQTPTWSVAASTASWTTSSIISPRQAPDLKKKRGRPPDAEKVSKPLASMLALVSNNTTMEKSSVTSPHPAPALKRRPGRPSKSGKISKPSAPTIPSHALVSSNTAKKQKVDKGKDSSDDNVPMSRRSRRTSDANAGLSDTIPRTMDQLILRFEEQYQEMGSKYREMGIILKEMKGAVANGSVKTEEEIRADILEEVQRNIMKSFPKK